MKKYPNCFNKFLRKKTLSTGLLVLFFMLPYISYFLFNTASYPVAFYCYFDLQLNQSETNVEHKLAKQLYIARNIQEVKQYYKNNGWILYEEAPNKLSFENKMDAMKINLLFTSINETYVLYFKVETAYVAP